MTSIIIPVYNAEKYLRTCIYSILAQSEQDWQLILVDDGSTDNSLALARQLAQQDDRISVFTQTHAGQSAARNRGLIDARGQFIVFVDADDAIDPHWLHRHLAAINGVDYVQSGYQRVLITEQQTKIKRHKLPLTKHQFTSPCMRLYRRQAIEGLQFPEGLIYEDVLFSVDLWLRGAKCRLIRYDGYNYTYNPDSTTSAPDKQAQQQVFNELHKRLNKASLYHKMIVWYTILRLKMHFAKS